MVAWHVFSATSGMDASVNVATWCVMNNMIGICVKANVSVAIKFATKSTTGTAVNACVVEKNGISNIAGMVAGVLFALKKTLTLMFGTIVCVQGAESFENIHGKMEYVQDVELQKKSLRLIFAGVISGPIQKDASLEFITFTM